MNFNLHFHLIANNVHLTVSKKFNLVLTSQGRIFFKVYYFCNKYFFLKYARVYFFFTRDYVLSFQQECPNDFTDQLLCETVKSHHDNRPHCIISCNVY